MHTGRLCYGEGDFRVHALPLAKLFNYHCVELQPKNSRGITKSITHHVAGATE